MNSRPRRPMLPLLIGNVLEWFDFALYGFFATTLATQFFSSGDANTALMSTLAVFGVAFVMRPLGGIVFGWIGDRWGRRDALLISFALMAAGTAMIALAPPYDMLGAAASTVVLLGRLLQGFSAAGEAGNSLAMIVEHAQPGRRARASAWLSLGGYIGLTMGSLSGLAVHSLLTPAQAQEWGWRLPFLVGLLIAPAGLYLRWHTAEPAPPVPAVVAAADSSAEVQRGSFTRGVLTMIGLAGFASPSVYLVLVFMPNHAVSVLGLPQAVPQVSTSIAIVLLSALLVPMGGLADALGHRRMLLWSSVAGAAWVLPAMAYLAAAPSMTALLFLQIPLSICLAAYIPACGPIAADLFAGGRRALGIGIGYNFGVVLFGAFAPLVTTWLVQASDNKLVVAWYVLATGSISIATVLTLRQLRPADSG